MPDTFPGEEFDEFVKLGRKLLAPKSDLRIEFDPATNLIAWRFRECSDRLDAYLSSSVTTFEDQYLRQRDFFGFLYSGESCIEATVYALHALASLIFGVPFGPKEQWFQASELVKRLEGKGDGNLTATLQAFLQEKWWKNWVSLRNRMTHGTNLPMRIRGTIGGPPPSPVGPLEFAGTSSTPNIADLDLEPRSYLFEPLTAWLRSLLLKGIALGQEK